MAQTRTGSAASLTSCERLRLELPEHFATALERLLEVLDGPDPEAALNQFWRAVDQAYGKPMERQEVQVGPIPQEELDSWSDEKVEARLKELEAKDGR